MRCYKVKHLTTGLYYCPSRKVVIRFPEINRPIYTKSNLSKKGKVYTQKPIFEWYRVIYAPNPNDSSTYVLTGGFSYIRPVAIKTKETDWEIEEV